MDDLTFTTWQLCKDDNPKGTWTKAATCDQYPDIEVRLHGDKDGVQFRQIFVGMREFPTLRAAYRVLRNQKVKRVGKNR